MDSPTVPPPTGRQGVPLVGNVVPVTALAHCSGDATRVLARRSPGLAQMTALTGEERGLNRNQAVIPTPRPDRAQRIQGRTTLTQGSHAR